MSLPQMSGETDWVDIVNKCLIYLRLPLLPHGLNIENLNHQDDAALLWQLCNYNHKVELSKGWWFNTIKNHEVDGIGVSLYAVPTPGYVDVLSITNSRRHCGDDENYTRYKFHGSSNLATTEDDENAEYKGLIDFTFAEPLTTCPPVYIDYIIKLSAQEFATVMDIPFNAELVDNALFELEKEQAKHREKLNVFTRRR